MAGRTGLVKEDGTFEGVVYMPCTAENNFTPELPKQHVDMIYLCSPNNPTGTTLSRDELAKWVKYAKENKSIIYMMQHILTILQKKMYLIQFMKLKEQKK